MIGSGGDAFHVASTALGDQDLVGVRRLLAQSRRSALHFEENFQSWKESANKRIAVDLDPVTRRRVTYTLHVDRIIPHHEWALAVGHIVNDARSALDHLNAIAFRRYANGSFNERRISFPIASTGSEWTKWKQKHRALAPWMVARYLAVQPFQQSYQGLVGLRELDDADKHRELTPISVALLGKFASDSFTVDGLVDDVELDPQIDAFSNVLIPGSRSATIGVITVTREIVSFTSDDVDEDTEFEPMFFFGTEHYTLRELVELPTRVASAVEYIAQNNYAELASYVARPAWLPASAGDDA